MKASSKYRHVFGTAAKNDQCFSALRIQNSAWDSNAICCSASLVAVPSQGGGGPVLIIPYDKTGKQAANYSAAGHKGNVLYGLLAVR